VIEVEGVTRSYERPGSPAVFALREVSFRIEAGEFVAVRGASGSGKSSLLHILGCLDRPTGGAYRLLERDVATCADAELARIRCRSIGFVFQAFHLLPRATALENVEIPMVYLDGKPDRRKALRALARVGLSARAHHYGSELSGGEQQRVALARALINDPPLVLADEPTGNLDAASSAEVMRQIDTLQAEGRTVVLITHDEQVARHAGRTIVMCDGAIAS